MNLQRVLLPNARQAWLNFSKGRIRRTIDLIYSASGTKDLSRATMFDVNAFSNSVLSEWRLIARAVKWASLHAEQDLELAKLCTKLLLAVDHLWGWGGITLTFSYTRSDDAEMTTAMYCAGFGEKLYEWYFVPKIFAMLVAIPDDIRRFPEPGKRLLELTQELSELQTFAAPWFHRAIIGVAAEWNTELRRRFANLGQLVLALDSEYGISLLPDDKQDLSKMIDELNTPEHPERDLLSRLEMVFNDGGDEEKGREMSLALRELLDHVVRKADQDQQIRQASGSAGEERGSWESMVRALLFLRRFLNEFDRPERGTDVPLFFQVSAPVRDEFLADAYERSMGRDN